MLDNILEISMLYDFYGDLLPPKQKEILGLYYSDNLSLSEIAGEYALTRQGIHDTIKRGEKKLRGYEEKLKLIEKHEQEEVRIENLRTDIDKLISNRGKDSDLVEKLREFKEKVITLNQ